MRIDGDPEIPPQDRSLRLRISPRRAVAVLGAGAALLIAGGILAEISRVGFDRGRLFGLVPLFDLDGEANLPATYSAGLLALAAAAVWLIASWRRQVGASHVGHLRFLALLLLFMAFDEASQIHELLSAPVRAALDLSGPLYYAWVVVYGAIALGLAVAFVPLVRHLEPRTRTLLLAAASLYVGGALGLELAGSGVADAGGRGTWSYAVLTTIEESLEMAGILLLLHVLLTCLRTACGEVNARLVATSDAPARPGLREGSPA
jgi:hypothetical protein